MALPYLYQRGVTLLELVIAVALMITLALLAAPGVKTLLGNHARQVFANELASGLRMARLEAVTRNRTVIVQAIEEDWSRGWAIVVDETGKGAEDPRNPILAVRAGSTRFQVIPSRNMQAQVAFSYLGVPRTLSQAALNGSIHLCTAQASDRHYRVVLARSGRVRVATSPGDSSPCPLS
jgi:type IV fimbrial biogenesis protein FimT